MRRKDQRMRLWTSPPGEDADEHLINIAKQDSEPAPTAPRKRPYQRLCLNCGKPFRVSPSSKTRTCSTECSSRHRSRKHLGKSNKWSDTSPAQAAAERTGNLLLGTAAARVSYKAGPYETNVSAKTWIVIDPSGAKHEATNLRLWCERNAARFEPHSWRSAYAGLRQVAAWLNGKTKRMASRWRGWTLDGSPK